MTPETGFRFALATKATRLPVYLCDKHAQLVRDAAIDLGRAALFRLDGVLQKKAPFATQVLKAALSLREVLR